MADHFDFPILKLELNASRLSLHKALSAHTDEIQTMIEASFGNAIEHIKAQMDAQVNAALSRVVADAVQQAAETAAEGLADELAEAMAGQVRDLVRKKMAAKK